MKFLMVICSFMYLINIFIEVICILIVQRIQQWILCKKRKKNLFCHKNLYYLYLRILDILNCPCSLAIELLAVSKTVSSDTSAVNKWESWFFFLTVQFTVCDVVCHKRGGSYSCYHLFKHIYPTDYNRPLWYLLSNWS